MMQLYVIIHCF